MNNDVATPLPGVRNVETEPLPHAPVRDEPVAAGSRDAVVESRTVAAETAKMFYWLAMR